MKKRRHHYLPQLATLPEQLSSQLQVFLHSLGVEMERLVAGAQVKALGRVLNEPGRRLSSLESLNWTVVRCRGEQLILGDVGPLAKSDTQGGLRPLAVVPDAVLVAMPLSPEHLLVGRDPARLEEALPLTLDELCMALACNSAEFIISSENSPRALNFASRIGTANASALEFVTAGALES